MTDRVYPSAKPTTTTNGTATGATNPPPKSHLYNPNRLPYRPQPTPRRRRRSSRRCLCLCCFWSILILAGLLLLSAIAGCVVYVLYNPRRPTFSVTALKIYQFNLSTTADDTTHLSSTLNLTISAKNPNKKLTYFYDPISITALSNNLEIANGSFPLFTSDPKNITLIRSSLSTSSQVVDADSVKSLRSDLKKKIGLPIKVVMDTKVVMKMENLKSKKVRIRVTCDGIHGVVPKGKSPSIASISDAKCKVDLRVKIWKWTF
ncbi:NDR1/HIN1-like protein 13 [Camellia lanceoleosa]|uniref:NDR1/HIN1-like protein 13 n=1 Tax=Camellia lanceoleosa TaxID=1840588 RepID=A0ACC0FG60_9ERIC|nr:NDR1/HIN1-like protein 13 [Camellia lanceoleosa]